MYDKIIKTFQLQWNFVPWGLSTLAPVLYTYINLCHFLSVFFSQTARAIFTSFHMGSFCRKGIDNFFKNTKPLNKIAAIPIYGKHT